MNRRDLLKLVPGAVVVAALPVPVALPKELPTEIRYIHRAWDEAFGEAAFGEAAFIEMRAPHALKAGEFVMWKAQPLGVATEDVPAGAWTLVQVYGRVTAKMP